MVYQILDAFNIHLLPSFRDPTDLMTSLRPHLVINATPFGVATFGFGTPVLDHHGITHSQTLTARLLFGY